MFQALFVSVSSSRESRSEKRSAANIVRVGTGKLLTKKSARESYREGLAVVLEQGKRERRKPNTPGHIMCPGGGWGFHFLDFAVFAKITVVSLPGATETF
jgi:hypothetical protein